MSMRSRRFLILAVGLVALNLVLWLAPPGLALQKALVNQLFGPRMIRAEVVVQGAAGVAQDYRIDRGVVTAVTPTTLSLTEADGTQQQIPLAPTTQLIGVGRRLGIAAVRRGFLVLVVHEANSPAVSIQIESRAGVQGIRKSVP